MNGERFIWAMCVCGLVMAYIVGALCAHMLRRYSCADGVMAVLFTPRGTLLFLVPGFTFIRFHWHMEATFDACVYTLEYICNLQEIYTI